MKLEDGRENTISVGYKVYFVKVCPLKKKYGNKVCLECPLPDYCLEERRGRAKKADLAILEGYGKEK